MADRSVVYRLAADVKGFQAGMAQASASTKKLAGDLTAADKAAATKRQSLTKLGNVAGGVGLVAAAGLGAAVMKAADFDQSMSKVQAATHETAGNMDALREAALDAGAQTAFSATEAAEGIENLAKAGVSTEEILAGGLMGALDLAAAGEMEVADAAEAAAGAMAQFKLEGSDVPHIADLLAAGAGKAQGEVSDMVMALKQGGTVASQTGLSIEETTGTLAAMAEQSLLGSDAGTSFKTMLSSLTPNSEKAASAMEQYNIHAFDAQGNFVGMTELAGQLREGLGGLTNEQRAATLETIFGSDAVRAASIIYDNGAKGIRKWIDNVDDAGYAAETAAIKQDNLRGDLEKLGGSLETALIGTGEGSLGPLRQLVQGLESVVNAYNKLPPAAQTATSALMGGAALLGGSVWVGTKLINGISSAREAFGQLGGTAGKTGSVLRGVGGAATVAVAGLAALAAVDAVQGGWRDYTIGAEEMTSALLELDAAGSADLPKNLDGLADSIDRLANPNKAQALQDNISDAIGGIGGGSELKEARAQIEALDLALSGLVSSGQEDMAEDVLGDLGLSESAMRDLLTLLPQYDEAVAGAANESKLAAKNTDKLAGSSRNATGAMRQLAGVSAEEAKALQKAHDEAAETGRAFFGLGEKVSDAKVSLGQWLRSLERQREALRDFRVNAQQAAKKGLDEGLIASLQEAGPEGALRMRQLANASKSEIGRANQVWRAGQREIDRYADSVARVPKDTNLRIDVASNAREIAAETASILSNLDDEIVYIHTVRKGAGGQGQGYDGGADGMTVGGDRYPYGDKVLAHLAPGEEVISNRYGQADRHRGLLKAINANRYADGGTVHHAASASMPSLAGMRIDGSVSVNGLEGMLRGVVREEIDNAELLRAESGRAW